MVANERAKCFFFDNAAAAVATSKKKCRFFFLAHLLVAFTFFFFFPPILRLRKEREKEKTSQKSNNAFLPLSSLPLVRVSVDKKCLCLVGRGPLLGSRGATRHTGKREKGGGATAGVAVEEEE